MSNAKIKEAIGDVAGDVELLEFVGFELKEENDEIWAVMEVPCEEQSKLINKVVGILENRKIQNSESSSAHVVAEEAQLF
ncbi:Plant UBX domain-containing protein 2 [Cardamine amara subsp. amara]|uniref:Plant UBX domain-containing protein 2 n=1 Tax=Cardamine amara subsp. amara TaxID=228776 RepID=A0ABD0YZ53_CARAN